MAELDGLTSDGLLQRFIPVMMGPAKLAKDVPCNDEAYGNLTRSLIFAQHAQLILDDKALEAMHDLRAHLHNLEQTFGGVAEGLQAFVGKLAGYAGSLAILLHMARDPEHGATTPITRHTIDKARRIVDEFILPNAYEFYQIGDSGDLHRRIASYVLTRESSASSPPTSPPVSVTCAACRCSISASKISLLVAAGWLDPVDRTPVCRAWNVNPAVAQQFAERARETTRKAAVREVISHAVSARRKEKKDVT